MVFGSLFSKSPRAAREECVREVAAALDALDYARAEKHLTDDVVVESVRGGRTEGREAFFEKHRSFRSAAGWAQFRIDELIHHGEEVLIRASLDSGNPEFDGMTMWRVRFRDQNICHIEITRAETSAAPNS